MKLSIDGILKDPSLHDGRLVGIVAKKGEAIKLSTEDHQGFPFLISLENAGSMNVMHFWGGDIILDVSLIPIGKAPLHLLKGLFHDRIADEKAIADAVSKDGRKFLFALECSYGADVFITCDQMRVEKGN